MEYLLLKMVNREDTSAEQNFMKTTYADVIDTTQLQIESDVLLVMFHNGKTFDDIITHLKKLPRDQVWGDTLITFTLRGVREKCYWEYRMGG